jgi:PKHD-type hydroxylase
LYDAVTIADAFSAEECAAIAALAAAAPSREAGLVGGAARPEIRRARLVWLDDVAGADWVMARLVELFRSANRGFGFDLTDFAESAQVARYDAAVQGHFGWHTDCGDGPLARRRKLTLVVQLSDPGAYAGGMLETLPDATPRPADQALGAATVFPSFVLHRVTPVTAGSRLSLTLWAHGNPFR